MSTPFPGVVQRWVDSNNRTVGELDTSGNFTATGGLVVTGSVNPAASVTQAITAANAIAVTNQYASLVGPTSSTYAVTLAAPARQGQTLVIEMLSTTASNAVTLALTNVVGGSQATSASFDAAGETLILVSRNAKWVVLKEQGVTLS